MISSTVDFVKILKFTLYMLSIFVVDLHKHLHTQSLVFARYALMDILMAMVSYTKVDKLSQIFEIVVRHLEVIFPLSQLLKLECFKCY